MALLAYFVVGLIVVLSWYYKKYNHRNKILSKFPTIKTYPLIGSNLSFIGKSPADIFKTLRKASVELGPVWRFDFSPFQSNIVVHDPKIAEGILSSQKILDKSIEYKFVKQWLNDGDRNIKSKLLCKNYKKIFPQDFCSRPGRSGTKEGKSSRQPFTLRFSSTSQRSWTSKVKSSSII